eukprot:231220_1
MSSPFDIVEAISSSILAIILIVIGVILLLQGAKLLKWILFLQGFVVATLFTYFFLHNIGLPEDASLLSYSIIISIVVGTCCGLLIVRFFDAAIFIVGAICGIIIAQLLWHVIASYVDVQDAQIYNVVLVIVFAIGFSFIAAKFVIFIAKPITAFIGGFLTISGLAYFIQRYVAKDFTHNIMDITQYFSVHNECGTNCWIFIGLWVVLCIVGIVVQHELYKKPIYRHIKVANDDSTGHPRLHHYVE